LDSLLRFALARPAAEKKKRPPVFHDNPAASRLRWALTQPCLRGFVAVGLTPAPTTRLKTASNLPGFGPRIGTAQFCGTSLRGVYGGRRLGLCL